MITRLALAAAVLASAPFPAPAQQIDMAHGGPIDVTARGGFEWRQNEQKVIAHDDARAVRGDVTVLADRLIAYYRKKESASASADNQAKPTQSAMPTSTDEAKTDSTGEPDTGGNEIYRLEADGHVRIYTPTDQAVGDHAIYDFDQAVLVLTGRNMKLTTPSQVMTARDNIEYWSQKHMGVGRGNAVVVSNDGRRLAADTLVGYTTEANEGQPPAAKPVDNTHTDAKPSDPLAASGKLKRVEAYGNVEVRTALDTVRGDRGVYVTDTDMARVFGHVRITRGQNQIAGATADVDMKSGIAHVVSDPGQRVEGLIMPNDATSTPDSKSGGNRKGSPPDQKGAVKEGPAAR
jgi:lipopolysaccharide export system protein LptA